MFDSRHIYETDLQLVMSQVSTMLLWMFNQHSDIQKICSIMTNCVIMYKRVHDKPYVVGIEEDMLYLSKDCALACNGLTEIMQTLRDEFIHRQVSPLRRQNAFTGDLSQYIIQLHYILNDIYGRQLSFSYSNPNEMSDVVTNMACCFNSMDKSKYDYVIQNM